MVVHRSLNSDNTSLSGLLWMDGMRPPIVYPQLYGKVLVLDVYQANLIKIRLY